MKEKSLVKNSLCNIIYQLLNVLFPLITSIYVSNILGATGIGRVAYAQNIVSYFVTLAAFGVQSYGIKMIARTRENKEERDKVFSELFFINFVSTTIFIIGYYYIIFSTEIAAKQELLYYVSGFLIILNYFNVDWFYQGVEEYAYITFRSFIIKVISLFLLFILVKDSSDYVLYAVVTCFATGGNYFFNIFHLRKFIKIRFRGLNLRRHLLTQLVLATNIILSDLYSKVDITMLGYLKGDAVTGYYSNAFKIVNIILSMCVAMTSVFLPRLSSLYVSDRNKYNKLINMGIQYVILIVIPTMVGVGMLAEYIIPFIFGNTFVPSVDTVRILCPLILIKGFGNIACYQVAISSGIEKKQTIAYAIGAVLNIMLNILLIPRFEQNGAAIASVISELAINIIVFCFTCKIVKVSLSVSFVRTVFVSVICMALSIKAVLSIDCNRGWLICFAIIIGSVVYLLINYIMKNSLVIDVLEKLKNIFRVREIND